MGRCPHPPAPAAVDRQPRGRWISAASAERNLGLLNREEARAAPQARTVHYADAGTVVAASGSKVTHVQVVSDGELELRARLDEGRAGGGGACRWCHPGPCGACAGAPPPDRASPLTCLFAPGPRQPLSTVNRPRRPRDGPALGRGEPGGGALSRVGRPDGRLRPLPYIVWRLPTGLRSKPALAAVAAPSAACQWPCRACGPLTRAAPVPGYPPGRRLPPAPRGRKQSADG